MTSRDKYVQVADALLRQKPASVLDVGCRDAVLGRTLAARGGSDVAYTGLDMVQSPDGVVDIVADISGGVPCPDGSHAVVVAVDVLEHLEDMESALDEFARVATDAVVVVLPNVAHVLHRVRFLATGRISGKYDLQFQSGPDRHRWVTVVPQVDEFMAAYARSRGLTVSSEDVPAGGHGRLETVARLARRDRSWTAYAVMYTLTGLSATGSPAAAGAAAAGQPR